MTVAIFRFQFNKSLVWFSYIVCRCSRTGCQALSSRDAARRLYYVQLFWHNFRCCIVCDRLK